MVVAVLTLLLLQAQPMMRPGLQARQHSSIATIQPQTRKQRMQSDAHKLLADAEAAQKSYAPEPGQPSKAELDAQIGQIKSDLDSMAEMGEMESLRLQMAMDRMSKTMSTLSNLLKKISDTSSTIVQNLK